jgi:hypothetical protein
MDYVNLSPAQAKALDKIRRNGRYGVGRYGGISRATVAVLERHGLVKVQDEQVRGFWRTFVYPV